VVENAEVITRFLTNMMDRPSGPLSFRFVLQPIVAIVLAIRAGIRDAKSGRTAYLWAVFTSPEHRLELLRDGWRDIVKLFVFAMILDIIFQLIVFKWVYPFEAIVVATGLACIPYVIVRGPVNHICKWINHSKTSST
jgi:hypothetical protein